MKRLASIIIVAMVMTCGCAAVKKVLKPANEVANALCELVAADYTKDQRDGMSVYEWCAIKENVEPFIDYILSAPQKVGAPQEEEEKVSLKNIIGLKKGTGWKPDPDESLDHKYGFSRLKLPTSSSGAKKVSLRRYVRQVFDQKSTNSCVGQAFAGAIGIREAACGIDCPPPSQLFIYFNGRAFHGDQKSDNGTYIRTAAEGLIKLGVPDMNYWAFSSNPLRVNRRPGWEPYMMAHARKGGEYVWIQESGDALLESIKIAIDSKWAPVFGTYVTKKYMDCDDDTPVEKPGDEKIIGGHASAIIGYEQGFSSLKFETLGSYGRGFADDGCPWLTDDYVAWEGSRNFCIVHGWPKLQKVGRNA